MILKKTLSLVVSVMIVLMSVSFAISFGSKEVAAAEGEGCCVYSESLGLYCSEDVSESECSGTFTGGISCDAISSNACDKVTCVEADGICSAKKFKKQCIDEGGLPKFEPLSSVPECSVGCCQIIRDGETINQYSVIFGGQCQADANTLGLDYSFLPNAECPSLIEQIGCCVPDSGDCSLTTTVECNADFNAGVMCSDNQFVDRCKPCGEAGISKCHEGDVWLFNECDEPIEKSQGCGLNSEICREENGTANCEATSCEIDLSYTSLTYDTGYFKAGEVGVEYKDIDGELVIEKIQVNGENEYAVNIPSGSSACVQYQGPGETHVVYTCSLGVVEESAISVFDGREKICEYNSTTENIMVRRNDYLECSECSDAAGQDSGSDMMNVVEWLSNLAQVGGWKALDIKMWDYWVFGPGECDGSNSCNVQGDCVHIDHNWCVPKYPVDKPDSCSLFTDSRAGSPYEKYESACCSFGNCDLKGDKKTNWAASVMICFTNTAIGKLSEMVVNEVGIRLFGNSVDDTKLPTKEGAELDAKVVETKSHWYDSIKGFGDGYLNTMGSFVKQVFTLGGVLRWDDLTAAGRQFFEVAEYSSEGGVDRGDGFKYKDANLPAGADMNGDGKLTGSEVSAYYTAINGMDASLAASQASSAGINWDYITGTGSNQVLVDNKGAKNSPPKLLSPPFTFNQNNNIFFSMGMEMGEQNTFVPYYGSKYYEPYVGEAENWRQEAVDWWSSYWNGGAVIWEIFSQQLASAGVNIVMDALLERVGVDFLGVAQWLSPQFWVRRFVCTFVAGWASFLPGVTQMCENADFMNFVSCTVIHGVNQGTYNSGVCVPDDVRKAGYTKCSECNENPFRDCTTERCRGLGTDCDVYSGEGGELICDANEDALKNCESTANDPLTVSSEITGIVEVEYSDNYYDLEIETSKFAFCRYTDNPNQEFSAWNIFEEEDRAGLNHMTSLWVGDPLIQDYRYFVMCERGCEGNQKSQVYEFNIHKAEKIDSEPPVIIESYPYTAQLLESTNSITMWVKADEALANCKYSEVDMETLEDEITGTVIDGITGDEDEEMIDQMVEDEFLNSDFMNPQNEMTRVDSNKFEASLTVEEGQTYLNSVVCEDLQGHKSRPKLILFKVSTPFDVVITEPESGSSTSEHIQEVLVSTSRDSECKYSFDTKLRYEEMLLFVETGEKAHVAQLTEALRSGTYDLFVSCVDFDMMDLSSGTSQFTIVPDVESPRLIRLVSAGSKLRIVLDEEVDCTYSEESFTAEPIPMVGTGSGTNGLFEKFSLSMSGANKYYISCKDLDGNNGNYIVYP
jgi:hypothetical protein